MMTSKRLVARVDDREWRVDVLADGSVHVESAPFRVARVRDGEYLVSEQEASAGSKSGATADRGRPRQWRLWVAGPPDAPSVHLDGHVIELEIATEGSRGRASRRGAGDTLAAPMPATVVEILVEPGQEVRQGDVLLKLEAMKMELPLRAPHDGRVIAVRCMPGELVQPGVPLVEME